MKRLSLGLFLALAAAVVWPAAGLALDHGVSAPPRACQRPSLAGGPQAALAQVQTQRFSRRGPLALGAATGPCTVTGTVRDFNGDVLPGVEVDLYYTDGEGVTQAFGWVDTDDNGAFTFTGVPETTDGEFDVYPDASDDDGFWSWGNTFTQAGPNDFPVEPGLTGAQIVTTSDPNWNTFESFVLDTWGSAGGGSTTIAGTDGPGYVMAPDYDYAVAYPWDNQGIEWSATSAFSVTPGVDDGLTMTFDQSNGRDVYIGASSAWGGSPGAKARVVLKNWPEGYHAGLYGVSESPSGTYKALRNPFAMVGVQQLRNVTVTVPSTATPGYDYDIHVARTDSGSALDIETYYQVASLKASRTSIRHGGSVRLTGIVPTQGHQGSTAGKTKSIVVYQCTKSAGQPTVWNAASKGWHKVATLKASGLGRYTSHLLHPSRTTWYVVRYPGDNWYYAGYTSVIKVTVK